MKRINAEEILSISLLGTSGSQLAKKFESSRLVHVDDMTLKRIIENKDILEKIMQIEGFRNINSDIEKIINKSEKIKNLRKKSSENDLSKSEKKELTDEQISYQKELQSKVCERSDIVITTAQLFGRPAPLLIDNKTIDKMKPGSVIFDMAVESGGNVEGSKPDEIVKRNGVKIIGISNLASQVAGHASLALSNNFNNWIKDFYDSDNSKINFDFEDEIIKSSVLVFDGNIKNERFQ